MNGKEIAPNLLRRRVKCFIFPLFGLYAFLSIVFVCSRLYEYNDDAVSYFRLAKYVSEGIFFRSVTAHWAPLISWCFAPFMKFNLDALVLGKIIMAVWGGIFFIGVLRLSHSLKLSLFLRKAVTIAICIMIAQWVAAFITPDIIIATLLTWYFYFVTSNNIWQKRGYVILSGFTAGLAYLAKQYALPFFLIHYPFALYVNARYLNGDNRPSPRKYWTALLLGIAVFFIVCAPWICLMSCKYNEVTVLGSWKRTFVGIRPDNDINARHVLWGMKKPLNYAITAREDMVYPITELRKTVEISNVAFYALRVWWFNFKSIIVPINNLALFYGCLPILTVAYFLLFRRRKLRDSGIYCWILGTMGIYCGGYGLLHATERYLWPVLILIPLLTFKLFEDLCDRLGGDEGKLLNKYKRLITALLIISFTLRPAVGLFRSAAKLMHGKPINYYKELAVKLHDHVEPFAFVNATGGNALFLAYYMDQKCFGSPIASDIEGITEELKEVNGRCLVVFEEDKYCQLLAETLKKDPRYELKYFLGKGAVQGWDTDIDVLRLNE